ncbi:MAG: FkbM family methyltransferase [Desulfobacca sp.]|uniref:FkbM family methyltransferase n=1 Tax=Desulfobacca sp. TaxID=2067990 RepID=UPI00404B1893
MSESVSKQAARAVFRWYLRYFPLRDGKARLYRAWHPALLPPRRFQVARINPGFLLRCDLLDPEQRQVYFFQQYHERYEARLIQTVLQPGDSFWDVGANIGYFALLAATVVGPQGCVLAWEPGRQAFQRLQENIALNKFPQITALDVAAADREGTARLYGDLSQADTGANLFQGGDRQEWEEVRTIPLDTFLHDHPYPPPQFLKIDVEGAELAVLRGAETILTTHTPLLLVEMEDKTLRPAGLTKQDIADFLRSLGYQGAYLHKGRWHRFNVVTQAKGRNIFWFREESPRHRLVLPALKLAR